MLYDSQRLKIQKISFCNFLISVLIHKMTPQQLKLIIAVLAVLSIVLIGLLITRKCKCGKGACKDCPCAARRLIGPGGQRRLIGGAGGI